MKILVRTQYLIALGLIVLSFSRADAQWGGIEWQHQTPSDMYPLHYFCGAADMDSDPGDELVFYGEEDRILILDGATGAVKWDSGAWYQLNLGGACWNGIQIYGFSPLCDINGDGRKEISFSGIHNSGDPCQVYVVGYTGSVADGRGSLGILSATPAPSPNHRIKR